MSLFGSAMPDVRVRRRRAELMDDPALDEGRHRQALQALSRINKVSLTSRRLWREVEALQGRDRSPVRVLDIACGGGDVLLRLAATARRVGRPVTLHGCDLSPQALHEARKAATAGGFDTPDVRFFCLDALRDPVPSGYDLVTSSLFLHHLSWPHALALLRRMADAARRRVFVQDLRRTRLGWGLAWLGLHTLTFSDVARVDGLRSVEGAFTVAEARRLCAESGLDGAVVTTAWPQRFVVRWDRGEA